MANGSHVPKFGNWDGDDDVPYTAYFENARKERPGGAARMNPNDPEENPDAFMLLRGFVRTDDLPPPISVETTEKYHHLHINEPRIYHQRNASDQQQKSSSPSSEKSNFSRSSSTVTSQQQHLNRRHKTSNVRKSSQSSSSSCSSNSFATRPPSKGGRNPSEDMSSTSASVPKFGAWDETDPKSGEAFTVIFNKVKEEKQITAAKFPPVQSETSKNRETRRNEPRNKMFCCLF